MMLREESSLLPNQFGIPRLLRRISTVHGPDGSVDERGFVGGEKGNDIGNFLRCPHASGGVKAVERF